MIRIDQIAAPPPASVTGKTRDTLRLTWEERRWGRRRVTTTLGREVALALPTGTVMPIGAVLCVGDDWYLEIEGAPEPVIAIRPHDHAEAMRIAFEVGNRHFTVALDGETLLVPDDTAMVQLLERLGSHWERRQAVYTPLGFHASDHVHPHGDDAHRHGHSHGHRH